MEKLPCYPKCTQVEKHDLMRASVLPSFAFLKVGAENFAWT